MHRNHLSQAQFMGNFLGDPPEIATGGGGWFGRLPGGPVLPP
jgi:hypothetical protein